MQTCARLAVSPRASGRGRAARKIGGQRCEPTITPGIDRVAGHVRWSYTAFRRTVDDSGDCRHSSRCYRWPIQMGSSQRSGGWSPGRSSGRSHVGRMSAASTAVLSAPDSCIPARARAAPVTAASRPPTAARRVMAGAPERGSAMILDSSDVPCFSGLFIPGILAPCPPGRGSRQTLLL